MSSHLRQWETSHCTVSMAPHNFLAPFLYFTNIKIFCSDRAKNHQCFYVKKSYTLFNCSGINCTVSESDIDFQSFLTGASIFPSLFAGSFTQIGTAAAGVKGEQRMALLLKLCVVSGGWWSTCLKEWVTGVWSAEPGLLPENWRVRCRKYYFM